MVLCLGDLSGESNITLIYMWGIVSLNKILPYHFIEKKENANIGLLFFS